MKRLAVAGVLAVALAVSGAWAGGEKKGGAKKEDARWVKLFNGKDLTGWKTHPKSPGKWRVENGAIVSGGAAVSHLFSERGDYEDFHFRIEAKINDKGNSGQYFRAKFAPGYPPGYEAQINSNFPPDPVRTGSLYPAFRKLNPGEREKIVITEVLHKPDEWFTQEVVARGNHIQIFVNGKKTVDFVDKNNTFRRGHFALQHHSAYKDKSGQVHECVLHVRKIEVIELKPGKDGN